jgi:hypothetical protein
MARKTAKVQTAPIDKLSPGQRRCLLFWAVIERYFAVRLNDEDILRSIETNGGMDKDVVRDIFNKYSLNRSVGKNKELQNANKFCGEVNKFCNHNWPDKIVCRAMRCAGMARRLKKSCPLRGEPASAVTKLVWFLKPQGWTIFDSYATAALGVGGSPSTRQMVDFYRQLDRRGFIGQADGITEILNRYGLADLRGERVIDAFLWLAGNSTVGTISRINGHQSNLGILKKSCPDKWKRLIAGARRVACCYRSALLSPSDP